MSPQPLLDAWYARTGEVLSRVLPPVQRPPQRLHEAMHYAVLGGGKRLRPLLAYAAGHLFDAQPDAVDAAAVAVEIIHAYSLVHDDLPAMDDDALRRGRPTCHIVFGEAMAILAGDALQALAFDVLADDTVSRIDAQTRITMWRVLATACGSQGMAGGQAFDLDAVGRHLDSAELERMHVHKTGALIRASVQLGALAAGCTDPTHMDALERYGHCIGLAFQIRDDILDVEGATEKLGKNAGQDQNANKPTYPAILGLDDSRLRLDDLVEQALQALAELPGDCGPLRHLAVFSARRDR